MLGEIPTDNLIADVTACSSQLGGEENGCASHYSIQTKHCGAYNVFCLGPTIHPLERYCIGKQHLIL